jgi:ribosome recycling factor
MPAPTTPGMTRSIKTAVAITDAQIRSLRRAQPNLLDTAMVALHSADIELRQIARRRFAEILTNLHVPKDEE